MLRHFLCYGLRAGLSFTVLINPPANHWLFFYHTTIRVFCRADTKIQGILPWFSVSAFYTPKEGDERTMLLFVYPVSYLPRERKRARSKSVSGIWMIMQRKRPSLT